MLIKLKFQYLINHKEITTKKQFKIMTHLFEDQK